MPSADMYSTTGRTASVMQSVRQRCIRTFKHEKDKNVSRDYILNSCNYITNYPLFLLNIVNAITIVISY